MNNMNSFVFLISFLLLLLHSIHSSAILNEHEHKLSDHEHYTDVNNDNKLEHNSEFDHEAFLGRDEAAKFKKLSPEERIKRLGEIVDKIDVDKDGFITETELQEWIKNVSRQYILNDVEERWGSYDVNKTNSITLEALLDVNYGALNYWSEEDKENKKDQLKTYSKMMERDKIRFKAADQDADGKLNKTEFANYLHPEEAPHMREILVNESFEDLDKNADGAVDIEEFILDMYPPKAEGTEEPDWVLVERENFAKYRDINGDGKLDKDEINNWILPPDYDHTLAEAKHLIFEADTNQDEKLTKDEILSKPNVFVSSQATAYGEAFADGFYKHDDL